jgi:subtilase family serine protease
VQLRRKAAFAVGIGSLATAGGLAALGAAGPTGPAGTTAIAASSAVAQQAMVLVHPDVIQLARGLSSVPTTAACEAAFHVACYRPAQLRQAYNLPALYSKGINGKGTTIAIVDPFGSPTIKSDLTTFDQAFGLPAPPSFTVIQPDGAVPPYNPGNSYMNDAAGETSLDVEWAHTIAPGANILLVETPVAETEGVAGFPQIVKAEEYALRHYHVDVISQSFEATEQTFPSLRSVEGLRGAYQEAYQQQVTLLAASGDSGATDEELDGTTLYPKPVTSWPDSDPLVTGVGGTQLHLDGNGNHVSPDTAWNDTYNVATSQFIDADNGPNPLASGGGKSILFPRPSYQNSVSSVVGNSRGVPDISMSAACNGAVDVYDSANGGGGWSENCGTSEATPLFAGIVALAAQQAGHPLGLINPALYKMSAQDMPGIVPVTSGNNTVTFSRGGKQYTVRGHSAQAGYSLVDGVGTVNAALFVPELAREAAVAGRGCPLPLPFRYLC